MRSLVNSNTGGTWRKQIILYLFFINAAYCMACSGANSHRTCPFRNPSSRFAFLLLTIITDAASASALRSMSPSSWHHSMNQHRPSWQPKNRLGTSNKRGLKCFIQNNPRRRSKSNNNFLHFASPARRAAAKTLAASSLNQDDFHDDLQLLSPPPSKAVHFSTRKGEEVLRRDEADILFSKDTSNSDRPSNVNDEAWFESLPNGTSTGFRIIKQYHGLPGMDGEFNWRNSDAMFDKVEDEQQQRLELSPQNITLPVALMMVDPDEYPSFSRARKACRKGSIVILTPPSSLSSPATCTTSNIDDDDDDANQDATMSTPARNGQEVDNTRPLVVFDPDRMRRGRVGDRVIPGDILCKQVRVGDGYSPILTYKKPPFDLPVIIEDDHFALVNKPAGVVVYGHHKGGHGVMTVRAALPFCLQPPSAGTFAIMRRPASVHRLDKATSGILCIAKTKPAMVHLSRQFHNRIIQKTYMAIINGIPQESGHTAISLQRARELGVDIQTIHHDSPDNDNTGSYVNDDNDDTSSCNSEWQLIDSPLDGKHAVTVWRAIRYVPSLHAHDGYLTLVEMKPKTGRYHQLRRHMAWVCERPIVGDSEYDNNTPEAQKFRSRGLFLCSSSITLQHPYLNSISTAPQETKTEEKRKDFKMILDNGDPDCERLHSNNKAATQKDKTLTSDSRIWRSPENGKVMISATIELPEKFESLLAREEERFHKFNQEKALL